MTWTGVLLFLAISTTLLWSTYMVTKPSDYELWLDGQLAMHEEQDDDDAV